MFIRILNSEMELATGCTEPGAVALTAAEAGQALRKAGVDKAEEITVNASINIIKNAMSAGIPGTDYEGMDYADVVKTTVFLADMNDFAEMNKVYGEYFAQPFPARSAVQVAKLPKGAPLEIECIAVK